MDGFIFEQAWLIPALPLFSFILLGLVLRPIAPKASGIFGTAMITLSFLLSCWLTFEFLTLGDDDPGTQVLQVESEEAAEAEAEQAEADTEPGQSGVDGEHAGHAEAVVHAAVTWKIVWLRYTEYLTVNMGTLIDGKSVLLLIVVTSVSMLVHIYSLGYMQGDPGWARYYTWLSLFTFSMLGLVLAPNIMQMFVFWELVGVSSFLLIGFYYQTREAIAASKKAFIVTRFADLFFLIGILIFGYCGYEVIAAPGGPANSEIAALVDSGAQALDFSVLNNEYVLNSMKKQDFRGSELLTVAMLLVFIGAAGKSAMFPLHIWLPDAMAGPTPVSALIHAATMVVAGVYLVARMFPAFAASVDALVIIAYVGCFTALFAALIACTQTDIKRVLAFSTLSQIGYMMFALGVATSDNPSGVGASLFHLYTHAFFKALLFLGAGSVIHAVHSNETTDMGGLKSKMPITHATFLIGTMAIAGVPLLSGFFSKDEILSAALDNEFYVVFGVGLFVAALTAFYMFRLYILIFLGEGKSGNVDHAHESPASMTLPLCVLAFMAVVAGYFPVSHALILPGFEHHSEHHYLVAGLSIVAALIGIFTAFYMYAGEVNRGERVATELGAIHGVVKNKFYIDEVYTFVTKLIFRFVSAPVALFDRHIVDGAMNLTAGVVRSMGSLFNRSQTGQVQTYVTWLINGTILVLLFFWLIHR